MTMVMLLLIASQTVIICFFLWKHRKQVVINHLDPVEREKALLEAENEAKTLFQDARAYYMGKRLSEHLQLAFNLGVEMAMSTEPRATVIQDYENRRAEFLKKNWPALFNAIRDGARYDRNPGHSRIDIGRTRIPKAAIGKGGEDDGLRRIRREHGLTAGAEVIIQIKPEFTISNKSWIAAFERDIPMHWSQQAEADAFGWPDTAEFHGQMAGVLEGFKTVMRDVMDNKGSTITIDVLVRKLRGENPSAPGLMVPLKKQQTAAYTIIDEASGIDPKLLEQLGLDSAAEFVKGHADPGDAVCCDVYKLWIERGDDETDPPHAAGECCREE